MAGSSMQHCKTVRGSKCSCSVQQAVRGTVVFLSQAPWAVTMNVGTLSARLSSL
jgi:hypothetical protein